MQTQKTKPWFVEAYKPELNKLLQTLLDDELETIIAIARKGPRLLEVIQKEWPKEGARLLKKVISNKAIPFSADRLRKENNGTIIFDDILIFGSTYLDAANAVREISGDFPPGLILAADHESSKAEPALRNIPCIQRMETSEIAGFSAQIVEAFYYLGKPFDLEHPIIELPLKMSREDDIEDFLSKSNLTFCNLTSTFQRSIGVFYFTADVPRSFWLAWERIIDSSTIEVESVKVRLYFDFVKKIVRLMPVVLFSISSDEIVKGPSFTEKFKFFDDLIKGAQKRTTGKQKEEAILGLINFLLAYMEGVYLLQFSALKCLFNDSNNSNPKINPFDLQILFGFDFGNYLHEKLNENLKTVGLLFTGYLSPRKENLNSTQKQISRTYAENLLSEIKKELKINKFKEEYPFADEPYSILKTIFSAMRVKDKRGGGYTPDRLKFGFSFNDLLYIINKEFDYTCNPFRISAALDYYIDRGVVIPIFIKDGGRWFRVFRFGEGDKNVNRTAFIIKNLLDTAATRFKKGIGSTDFEKILVLLHDVFKNNTELGYEVYDYIRGKRPYYVSKHPSNIQNEKDSKTEPIELTDWAVKECIIKIDPAGRGYAKYIHLHPDFERCHQGNPWNERERIAHEIDYVIDFSLDVLDLKLKNITKDELRLALSTCYNEEETLQAIIDELFGWFEEPAIERTNFRRIINDFKIYLSKLGNGSESEKIDKNLGHVDEHLTQAFNKRETFKKLDLIKETLDKIYVRSNKDRLKAYLAPTYNGKIRPLFDSNCQYDAAWKDINILLDLCNTLTSLARTFLSEKNLIAGDKDRKISIEVERYNSAAKKYPTPVFENNKVFQFQTINEEYYEKLLNSNLISSFNSFVNLLDTLYRNLYEFYENRVKNVKFYSDIEFSGELQIPELLEGTDIQEHVLKRVLNIASEISREGREGKQIGTAFVIGDSDNVLQKSKDSLKPNPYANTIPENKMITDESLKETIKELAQVDGVFVVRDHGVIEAAGRLIKDLTKGKISEGFGTRHTAVSAITSETKTIGILISESGGKIKIFKNGEIVATLGEITQIN